MYTLALHSTCLHSHNHPCGQGSLYSLVYHLSLHQEPCGSSALSLVSCQLPSILNSPRSLTTGEGWVWLSFLPLPSIPSALPNLSLPLFMDGVEEGSLTSRKEGSKGGELRGTKLRPVSFRGKAERNPSDFKKRKKSGSGQ